MNRREENEAATRWARSVLDADAAGREREAGAARQPAAWPATWPEGWAALEMPPSPPAPAGFARRVAGAWAAEQAAAAAPLLGAAWMRAAALAALLAGIALGSTLSSGAGEASVEEVDSWQATSLSEEYLQAIAAPESALATPEGENDSTESAP